MGLHLAHRRILGAAALSALFAVACLGNRDERSARASARLGQGCAVDEDCTTGVCAPLLGPHDTSSTVGVCSVACTSSADCVSGWPCVVPPGGRASCACAPSPEVCDGLDNDCNGGVDDGFDACVAPTCAADLATDPTNCGACGAVCPGGTTCTSGRCQCAAACSGACVDLATDRWNCGACDFACGQGAACVDGTCTCDGPARATCGAPRYTTPWPPICASDGSCHPVHDLWTPNTTGGVTGVAVTDQLLVYSESTYEGSAIKTMPKAGGAPTEIYRGVAGQPRIEADGVDFVYQGAYPGPSAPNPVIGCPLGVCGATLPTDGALPRVSGGNAYWVDKAGSIVRCSLTGCPAGPTLVSARPASVAAGVGGALGVDATGVYVAYGTSTPTEVTIAIFGMPAGGSALTPIYTYNGPYFRAVFVISPSHVFLVSKEAILRCPKTGCSGAPEPLDPSVVARSSDQIDGIVSDDKALYWSANNTIWMCPHTAPSCATPVEVADFGYIRQLAQDADHLYWYNGPAIFILDK